MAKEELDNKKMWESFIRECYDTKDKLLYRVAYCARLALSDQNYRYDGEIVSIGPEFKIEAGKYYVCTSEKQECYGLILMYLC